MSSFLCTAFGSGLGGKRNIIGQQIRMNGEPYTVSA